ncbi:MAG: DUF3224 domain-containing protein [Telluria sp.]
MTQHANGPFEVTMTPAGSPEHEGRTAFGRLQLDKQYAGDLVAIGNGQMLTAVTDTQGSAAYVAIERIRGNLKGKKGSFAIHHTGTMSGGLKQLMIAVVTDSGTDELTGIAGTMSLTMVEGKHFYGFDYTLP